MKTSRLGIWGGISVLLFAILFFSYSLQYPYKNELGPGPGFFPIWLSGLLIILAAVYIYEAARGNDSAESMPDKAAQKVMLAILMSMIMYVILLPVAGFVISSIIFLSAMLAKGYKWHANLAISTAVSISLFVLFTIFLEVQLPVNAWGF